MRVFLDTNVIVSALATRGLCADLVQVVLADHDLLVGETVLAEVRRVLSRKMKVRCETLEEIDAFLRQQAFTVAEANAVDIDGLQAADRRIVAEALAAAADVLVTGDRELLASDASDALRIVSPRGLWELLRR